MEVNPKTISIGIFVALILIILFQNTDVVTLSFLFWKISMSQVILIPIILIMGFIAGYIVGKRSW